MVRNTSKQSHKQLSEVDFENEIHILPDGAVVILNLDETMLDLALALNPEDYRLRRRRKLLQRKVKSPDAAK